MHHLPHNTLSVASNPPSIQINYSSRRDSRQPKSTKENILDGTSDLTMKQKMVHKLLHSFYTNNNQPQ